MILTDNNVVAFIGNIERGIYPEADGSCELYKITNDEGVFYAVTGFTFFDVEVPAEVEPLKWCYTEADGFYLNPDYHGDEPSDMDRMEAQVTYTAMMTDTLLEV